MSDISVIKQDNKILTAARNYDPKALALIKRTVAKDTTTDEFNMFIEICKRQGLDPFRGQIYALVFNKDKAEKRQVNFITGIGGYRAIAKRAGNYRPDENEPDIEYSQDAICPDTNPHGIVKAKVTVWQYAVDGWYPIVGSARWEEFAPIKYETEWINKKPVRVDGGKKWLEKDTWKTMGHIMLAKCAEAQALRKGWPEETGPLYIQEEVDAMVENQIASDAIEQYEEEERMKAVNAINHIPMIMAMTEGLEMVADSKLCDEVLKLLNDFDDAEDVIRWREMNRVGLQLFWAKNKNDALELKKQIEGIVDRLKSQNENA